MYLVQEVILFFIHVWKVELITGEVRMNLLGHLRNIVRVGMPMSDGIVTA